MKRMRMTRFRLDSRLLEVVGYNMKIIETTWLGPFLAAGLLLGNACSSTASGTPPPVDSSDSGTGGLTGSGGEPGSAEASSTDDGTGSGGTDGQAVGGAPAATGGSGGSDETTTSASGGGDVGSGGASAEGSGGVTSGGAGGLATGGVGGTDGSGGSFENPDPATWGSSTLAIDEVPLEEVAGYCTPPCAVEFIDNGDLAWPDSISAALYIDFDAPDAWLYQDMSLADESLFAMGFTYEDNQYGYSAYFSSPMTDIFALNLQYTTNLDYEWDYSIWQDEIITFQITAYSEQKMALVSFSFGDQLVRVHQVRIPSCSTSAGAGACTNAADCPLVDAGEGGQSLECIGCYDGIAACTASYCAAECAEDLAGNGCLRCQTDAGCHLEFMECSGLDFLPWNSLEFPEW